MPKCSPTRAGKFSDREDKQWPLLPGRLRVREHDASRVSGLTRRRGWVSLRANQALSVDAKHGLSPGVRAERAL
jgi:hypothetical protein